MISKDSELRVDVDRFLSHKEKLALIERIKEQYGVSKIKINDVGTSNGSISSRIQNSIQDDVKLHEKYEQHLKNKSYDKKLFEQIDQQVLSYMPDLKEDYKKNYQIKYLKGKNILSYGPFEFDVYGIDGINVVYSDPENYGGKSNFYKLFQILLWGEYIGVGTKSKIDSLPNKFLKQNAYIEGIIQIEDNSYFIRRDYVKKGKSYNHVFHIFLLTDENEANCFFINDEHSLDVIDIGNHNPSMEGFFAQNLNTKNTAEAKKDFIDQIGTLADFQSNCYFDQLNINSLLLEKPTARTREFYNLFGGKYFEKKKEIAKDILYKKFKEKSVIHQHDLAEIKSEIKLKQTELKELKSKHQVVLESINQLEKQIKDENTEKEKLIYELKDVINIDIDNILVQKKEIELQITHLSNSIKELSSLYDNTYTQNDYESFRLQEAQLYEQIDEIKADDILSNQLISLEQELKNNSELSELESKIKTIEEQKINIKIEFNSIKEKLIEIKSSFDNLDEPQKCPHCGEAINDVEQVKKHLEDEQNNLSAKKERLLKKSYDLVEQQKECEIKSNEIKNKYQKQIEELKKQIDINISERKKIKNEKLKEIREKIETFHKQREVKHKINSKKNEIEQLNSKLKGFQKDFVNYKLNEENITYNLKIKEKISSLEEKINEITLSSKNLYQRLSVISSDISRNELIIDQQKELLKKLSDDIKMDAAYVFYIKAHDKDGIIRDIIASYLDEINAQLKEPLCNLHFDVEIRQINGIIEYFKIDKNTNVVMPLSDASNFERFVSISALHLVKLKYSTAVLGNIMFFDEVFAQTHDVNVPILYSSLEQYKDLFQVVMVISHRESVKRLADNEIKVSKNLKTNVSKIEKY